VFINEFGDLSSIDKTNLEEKSGYKIQDLFKKQRNSDMAKKKLGRDFNKAMAAYFNRFVTKDGVDAGMLKKEIDTYEPVLKLHLKKDAMRYLKLIAQIGLAVGEQKKGLL
jgi:hypothetical protein